MALDGSAFSLKLGFKDNPSGPTDDFVNLNSNSFSAAAPQNGRGILLKPGGFTPGPIETDTKWGQVQTLTITVRIDGDSKDDCIALLRNLNRFIQRSNFYFQDVGDNVPARNDGRWHDGEAAVLTYQAADATYPVYFDVISGTPAQQPDLVTLSTRTLDNITFTLKIRAGSRLDRVKLNNGVAMGDAAEPFSVDSTSYGGKFTAGWAFTGTWFIGEDNVNYPAPLVGVRTLVAHTAGATFTTNSFEVKTGDLILPALSIAFGLSLPTGGTFTVKLQGWNGTSWVDKLTLVNLSSFTGLASPSFDNPKWNRYSNGTYTVESGITLVRLTGTLPTLTGNGFGRVGFDKFAMWKNIGSTEPLTEYCTGGKTMGIPTFNVYGLRGDVKVPVKMRIDNPSSSQLERFFIVSGMTQDLGVYGNRTEFPLFGLDLKAIPSGTTAAQLPWGTLPGDRTGTGTSESFALDSNFNNRALDRHPRIYRAFLVYAANDAISISAVKLGVAFNSSANLETKTYNTALPNTYTGNTTPTASQYAMFELGDFELSRPGIAWENNIQLVNPTTYVTITHTSSANRHLSVAGVILLPTKPGALMAATFDIGTANLAIYPLAVELYSEGKALRGGIQPAPLSGDIPVEVNSYDPTGLLKGKKLWVLPAEASTPTMAMRFEILMLRSRDATTKLFSFDARDAKQVSIEYTPRYLYGMAS